MRGLVQTETTGDYELDHVSLEGLLCDGVFEHVSLADGPHLQVNGTVAVWDSNTDPSSKLAHRHPIFSEFLFNLFPIYGRGTVVQDHSNVSTLAKVVHCTDCDSIHNVQIVGQLSVVGIDGGAGIADQIQVLVVISVDLVAQGTSTDAQSVNANAIDGDGVQWVTNHCVAHETN